MIIVCIPQGFPLSTSLTVVELADINLIFENRFMVDLLTCKKEHGLMKGSVIMLHRSLL